jgi:hypothetical protein
MALYCPWLIKLYALTLTLGEGWSVSRPGHFTSGESFQYLPDMRLGGHHSHCGHGEEKNPTTTGNQVQAVQPTDSNFIDQATAHDLILQCSTTSKFFYKRYL